MIRRFLNPENATQTLQWASAHDQHGLAACAREFLFADYERDPLPLNRYRIVAFVRHEALLWDLVRTPASHLLIEEVD